MSEKETERLTRLLRVCGRRLYHSSCAGRTQARVLGLTGKLELKGFVTRSRDEKDRRRVVLTLTPAGQRAAEAAAGRKDVTVRYDGLTGAEQAQLEALLEKVIEGWRKDGVPESELTF